MLLNTILEAWRNYCVSVLPEEWTVTYAEDLFSNDGPRPAKPFLTLNLLAGPRPLTIDDELRNKKGTDDFYLVGQRAYTLSIQAFGSEYVDGLSDIQICLGDLDKLDKLKLDADISVTNKGTILPISSKIETGYERRASLDIFFNSSNNKITDIKPIESVEIKGSMKNADGSKTVDTNMPIINKN